jgi:hypothetical protein
VEVYVTTAKLTVRLPDAATKICLGARGHKRPHDHHAKDSECDLASHLPAFIRLEPGGELQPFHGQLEHRSVLRRYYGTNCLRDKASIRCPEPGPEVQGPKLGVVEKLVGKLFDRRERVLRSVGPRRKYSGTAECV